MALCVCLLSPNVFEVALKRVDVGEKGFRFGLYAFLMAGKVVPVALNVYEIGLRRGLGTSMECV